MHKYAIDDTKCRCGVKLNRSNISAYCATCRNRKKSLLLMSNRWLSPDELRKKLSWYDEYMEVWG